MQPNADGPRAPFGGPPVTYAGSSRSFIPQRDRGIDSRPPPRRDVTRNQRDGNPQQGGGSEGYGIGGAQTVEEAPQQACKGKRAGESEGHAHSGQHERVGEDQPQAVAPPRPT